MTTTPKLSGTTQTAPDTQAVLCDNLHYVNQLSEVPDSVGVGAGQVVAETELSALPYPLVVGCAGRNVARLSGPA